MISVKENSLNKHPLSFLYCCPDCTAVYALLSNTVAFIMSSFMYGCFCSDFIISVLLVLS